MTGKFCCKSLGVSNSHDLSSNLRAARRDYSDPSHSCFDGSFRDWRSGDRAYITDVQTSPCGLYPSREKFSVDRPRGIGLSPVNQISSELSCGVVIDNIGNGDGLFRLTISCLIDRYAEAVTRLPGVFHIWVLLNGADDGFAADPDTGGFSVPPKEPPTIRSTPPMAEPQISWLIANAHDPSSGDCNTGDELMPAWMELRGWPGYA